MKSKLIIGTRKSNLAMYQAHLAKKHIEKALKIPVDIRQFVTSGDRIKNVSLAEFGGKGLFTMEIEKALDSGEVDIAIHSMKDLEKNDKYTIPAVLPRIYPYDAFVSNKYLSLAELPENPIFGTSSPRRAHFAKALFPKCEIVNLRGNVETRLAKLDQFDGIFLAIAGLSRLSLTNYITEAMTLDQMIPAIGQGVICLQIARAQEELYHVLHESINCQKTYSEIALEREFLYQHNANCNTAIACHVVQNESKNFSVSSMYLDEYEEMIIEHQTILDDRKIVLS